MVECKLLVIRTSQPEKLVDFYSMIGLEFEYHKHSTGPYHYSANVGNMILEIYPLSKNQLSADKNLRLGFGITNFEETLILLQSKMIQLTEPTSTDFGIVSIVIDPDGRKVELYKS